MTSQCGMRGEVLAILEKIFMRILAPIYKTFEGNIFEKITLFFQKNIKNISV